MINDKMGRSSRIFFYFVLLVSTIAAVLVIGQYWSLVILALATVVITRPLYSHYVQWLRDRQALAIALTLLTIVVVIVVPAWIVITMTIGEVQELAADAGTWSSAEDATANSFITEVNKLLAQIPGTSEFQITGESLVNGFRSFILSFAGWLASQVVSIGATFAVVIMKVIIFIMLLVALYPGWPGLVRFLMDLSPLDEELDQLYVDRLTIAVRGMAWAGFVSIVSQAATMTFFLWITGLDYLFFWFMLALFLSVLPTGCSLIAFPVGIILILTGQTWQGLVVILGYILVTANVAPVVQASLFPEEAKLNQGLDCSQRIRGHSFVWIRRHPLRTGHNGLRADHCACLSRA